MQLLRDSLCKGTKDYFIIQRSDTDQFWGGAGEGGAGVDLIK